MSTYIHNPTIDVVYKIFYQTFTDDNESLSKTAIVGIVGGIIATMILITIIMAILLVYCCLKKGTCSIAGLLYTQSCILLFAVHIHVYVHMYEC